VQTAIEKGLLDETVDDQDRRRRRITMSPQLLKVIEDFLDASLQTFEKRRVFS
jgi:DNA-binding MarR family transcriptional regulator